MLAIQLVKCYNSTDYSPNGVVCKSPEEIKSFFKAKYLLLFYNQRTYQSELLGPESITGESRIDWIRINTQFQSTLPYNI